MLKVLSENISIFAQVHLIFTATAVESESNAKVMWNGVYFKVFAQVPIIFTFAALTAPNLIRSGVNVKALALAPNSTAFGVVTAHVNKIQLSATNPK